ncbi:hypothetical protein GCM10007940_24520 [Portibacter lacus]|uniref:TonB-dependent receptor n=1 Tax=Portibacter lacus TaxID=1099794 RepID=A0AA37SPN7_9BACT|nr:hypothetical protein GCM10007940_24520 [Portibacter lacus]
MGVECYNGDFSFATTTDLEGNISIPLEFQNDEFTFKYLGFETISVDLSLIEKSLIELTLQPKNEILEEVVLIGRNDIRSEDFLQKIDAVQSKEIASSNPQTSVDALARYADVYIQKSQMGGGSPVIRGFEANKVLLVVDGVRMNNAIYRNGHLQNAITIDNAILDQMEVIYGPSSLMYGSDALGGVVHFRTKEPMLNLRKDQSANVFGNYYARYGSASNEKSVHADVNIGLRKWGSLTSISYSDFGDLRMGANRTGEYPDFAKRPSYQSRSNNEDVIVQNENENVQVGTGYKQFDFLQKIRYQINDQMNLTANLQYSASSDIPRYDQLVLLDGDQFEFAEWYYGPQKRGLASLKYKWTEERAWMDEFIVIASRQNIEESRITRGFNSDLRTTGIESVGVNALTIDISKKIRKKRTHMFYYGADANYNLVNSIAYEENINTGDRNDNVFTRYPSGGSSMNILGAYAQYVNESEDSTFVFHGGVRFSSYTTKVKYLESDPIQWPSFFYDGVTSTNSSVSWSAGMNWKPTQDWTIRFLAATAFRAPNVDDIGKLRVNNGNALVPNNSLGAERSINSEININRNLGRGSLVSGSFFYTRLSDAIVRQDFMLPDGSTTFSDGDKTYNVEGNVNAENAELYGVSLNLKYRLMRGLDLTSSISYVKGEILGGINEPLAHIPPVYGKTQLKYSWTAWNFTLLSQYNGMKPVELYGGSSDNPEYATPEGALPWTIFNLYTDYSIGSYTFQLGIENILDKQYTPFASGVSGSGFNVIAAVRGKF